MVSSNNNFVRPANFSQKHRKASFLKLNSASERRRGDFVRAANVKGTTHVISGLKELIGSGESIVDIKFPVSFIQYPVFLHGSSLAAGTELVDGSYPVVSAVVASWEVDEPDRDVFGVPMRRYFKGARIAITTTGPDDQRLLMNWQFSGVALTNPLGSQRSIPDPGEARIIS